MVNVYRFCAQYLNLLPIWGKYKINGGSPPCPHPHQSNQQGSRFPLPAGAQSCDLGLANQMPWPRIFTHWGDDAQSQGQSDCSGGCGRIESPMFLEVVAATMRSSLLKFLPGDFMGGSEECVLVYHHDRNCKSNSILCFLKKDQCFFLKMGGRYTNACFIFLLFYFKHS